MKISKLCVVWLGMLIMLTGCGGEHSHNPILPDLPDDRQMQEAPRRPSDDTQDSEVVSPQYPDGATVIVAIGDSITYGWDSTMGGYPAMLEASLLAAGYNVVVINEGVPGERSHATEDRFLEVIAGADIALIMIGINDIVNPMACYEPYNCRTIEHIETLLDKALISKTVPLVSTVMPVNSEGTYAWANSNVQASNAQIYEIALERDVYVVDNYTAILDNGGSALYSDNLHFTDQGYGVLAQQWFDALVENSLIQ